jgi:hypothetical protein
MRWNTVVAVLVCAGLVACGSGGDDDAEPSAAGEGGGEPSAPEEGGGGEPAGATDAGACPSEGEVENLTGEEFRVADQTAQAEGELDLACLYETEDVRIRLVAQCADYASADEARADLIETMSEISEPYPVGEEALVMDNSMLGDNMEVPILSETAMVRSGAQICTVQYQVQDPDGTEPPDGVREAMEYLATETLP